MLLVAPSSPEKRAAHQRHMRQTQRLCLWVWITTLSLHTFRPSTVSLRAPAGPGIQTATLF